jgi:hypothetical protein
MRFIWRHVPLVRSFNSDSASDKRHSIGRMEPLPQLTDFRMHDGSRHFVSLAESAAPRQLLLHVFRLGFAVPYFYISVGFESWLDFWYRGHRFTVNNQFGEYWFFVKNPACPTEVLDRVASHFGKLLQPPPTA